MMVMIMMVMMRDPCVDPWPGRLVDLVRGMCVYYVLLTVDRNRVKVAYAKRQSCFAFELHA